MVKRRSPEEGLQRAVADYLQTVLPPEYRFTAFPAGGGGKTRGAVLKAMGLAKGVPDMMILGNGTAYFIELKAGKNTLTPEQRDWLAWLEGQGYECAVCRSLSDVKAFLAGAGIETREVEGAA